MQSLSLIHISIKEDIKNFLGEKLKLTLSKEKTLICLLYTSPAGARFPLPALPARADLRDAEVHAMLGELDFGESAVMGDATAEERQAIANFDIRAYA